MPRPKKDETMETVSVRLPKVMVTEIDNFVEALKGDMPLLNISRQMACGSCWRTRLKAVPQLAGGRLYEKANSGASRV